MAEQLNNIIIDTIEKKLCTSYSTFILIEKFEKLLFIW